VLLLLLFPLLLLLLLLQLVHKTTPTAPTHAPSHIPSHTQIDGNSMDGQPLATPDDCLEAERIARASPRVVALLSQRGVTDMRQLACDPWAIHAGKWKGRLMQVGWVGWGADGLVCWSFDGCRVV
jgi:hypothetical protein